MSFFIASGGKNELLYKARYMLFMKLLFPLPLGPNMHTFRAVFSLLLGRKNEGKANLLEMREIVCDEILTFAVGSGFRASFYTF